jgi:hypothetical protein
MYPSIPPSLYQACMMELLEEVCGSDEDLPSLCLIEGEMHPAEMLRIFEARNPH